MAALAALYVGVSTRGMKARPEVTVMTVEAGRARRCGNRAMVSRIGPSRLVAMVVSAVSSEKGSAVRSSGFMTPALLTMTLRSGCSCTARSANVRMAAASSMSSVAQAMPGLASETAFSGASRRPVMMTRLPRACRLSARARPMPLPPPVIRMVLPVIFMSGSFGVRIHAEAQL
ncbi:hypothetical protein D3C81_1725000 [compost metagenome]